MIHPIFKWFENWCQDEFRHGEAFAILMRAQPEVLEGRNKLWIRFFLLAVFATMYVRDHLRATFYEELGFDVTEYDFEVFRKTSEISKQVFPLTLDLDNPKFKALLDRMADNTQQLSYLANAKGPVAALKRANLKRANAACFVRLFALPVKPNTLPANVRMEPAY